MISSSGAVQFAPSSSGNRKWIRPVFKLAVTAICLLYVAQKVDFGKSLNAIAQANPFWLLLSLLAFAVSKMLASVRLNIYFRNIQIPLPERENLRLYWLGMFYNLFLPGSIGGDAYKVVRLTRTYAVPYRLTTSAVLLDRLSGLAALGLLAAANWVFLFRGAYYSGWIMGGAVAALPVFYFVVKKYFARFMAGFWPTLAWGFAVQLLQMASMECLLLAVGVNTHTAEYMLIFLLSSVFAVLPFTIGGLGARELVFVWGAGQFLLNREISVTTSLLFYGITIAVSLPGLAFVFIDPLRKKTPKA